MKIFTHPTAVITLEEMVSDLIKYHTQSNTNSISDFIMGVTCNFERFKGIAKRYENVITEWVNLCADDFYTKHPEVYHIVVQTDENEEGFCRWVCSWLPEEREYAKKELILPHTF